VGKRRKGGTEGKEGKKTQRTKETKETNKSMVTKGALKMQSKGERGESTGGSGNIITSGSGSGNGRGGGRGAGNEEGEESKEGKEGEDGGGRLPPSSPINRSPNDEVRRKHVSTRTTERERHGRGKAERKTPLFEKNQLLDPQGKLLVMISAKKVKWYLKKGLGALVSGRGDTASNEEGEGDGKGRSLTVQLLFEPGGRDCPRENTGATKSVLDGAHCGATAKGVEARRGATPPAVLTSKLVSKRTSHPPSPPSPTAAAFTTTGAAGVGVAAAVKQEGERNTNQLVRFRDRMAEVLFDRQRRRQQQQ
jgi:hypothetical protein